MWMLTEDPLQDDTENYAWAKEVFTDEEIQKIIDIGLAEQTKKAEISNKKTINEDIRKAEVSWIFPNEKTEWLFRKLTDLITSANARFFNFHLIGMFEGLQFTIYKDGGDKYEPHLDKVYAKTARKLSFVLQLSDPEDYEGGELKLYTGHEPVTVEKEKGLLCSFPSYTLHGVTPVTKGTRYSLVIWVHGPPFR